MIAAAEMFERINISCLVRLLAGVGPLLLLALAAHSHAASHGPLVRDRQYAMARVPGGARLACVVQRLKRSNALRITNRDPLWIKPGRTLSWRTSAGDVGSVRLDFALHSGKSIRLRINAKAGRCAAWVH